MKKYSFVLCAIAVVVATGACKYPALPAVGGDGSTGGDGGGGGDGPPPTVELTSVHPAIATTGQTVVLEGQFSGATTVMFPGGATAAAVLLGPARATAVVPDGATAGELTVTTPQGTSTAVPFRRASFGLGVGAFRVGYEQTDLARQAPALVTARAAFGTVALPGGLYVIGGGTATGGLAALTPVNTVERARINADGTLGAFATVAGATFARHGAAFATIGSTVYALGGMVADGTTPTQIDAATVAADGTLGNFTAVAGQTLTTGRRRPGAVVIGDWLYVLGGVDGNGVPISSVERAPINLDGSLGAFAAVDQSLVAARYGFGTLVTAGYVFAIGGIGAGAAATIESAPILPDGSLGTFAIGPSLPQTCDCDATAELGGYVYTFGGTNQTTAQATTAIFRAAINADGSLGAFTTYTGALTAARTGAGIARAGNFAYVLGGLDASNAPQASVERAPLNVTGAIGALSHATAKTVFQDTGALTLALGNYLYVVGGGAGTSVERAPVAADGTLGAFADTMLGLTTNRTGFGAAIAGNFLYVFGGASIEGSLTSIERAPIAADGTLGAFAAVATTLTTGREQFAVAIAGSDLWVIDSASSDSSAISATGALGAFAQSTTVKASRNLAVHLELDGAKVVLIGGVNSADADQSTAIDSAVTGSALGAFAALTGVTLATAGAFQAPVIVGPTLYLLGGDTNSESLIETAPISATTLGTFTASATKLLDPCGQGGAVALGNYLYMIGCVTAVTQATLE